MRLQNLKQSQVDSGLKIAFTFDGKTLEGYAGDTLASALIANNCLQLTRSFKYGRKRGLMAAGVEEPNALVSLESGGFYVPNVKATDVMLYEGLVAKSAIAADKFDIRAFLKPFHRFMPAGFYYKTFIIQKVWSFVEDYLRKLSGFSEAPTEPDAEYYDHVQHHVDYLVIGGGVAGMNATIELLKQTESKHILLVDERAKLGGELFSEFLSDSSAQDWYETALEELRAEQNQRLTLLTNTTAFSWNDQNFILAVERITDNMLLVQRQTDTIQRQMLHHIRADKVILATGAHERPMLFQNNDLTGVMLAQSVRRYANEFAVAIGKQVVVYGNNDSIYSVAYDLQQLGCQVTLIDVRSDIDSTLIERMTSNDIEVLTAHAIITVEGKDSVHSVKIAPVKLRGNQWQVDAISKVVGCDVVACSGGFNPVIHLDCHCGGKPKYNKTIHAFMTLEEHPQRANRVVCGAVNGNYIWQNCISETEQLISQLSKVSDNNLPSTAEPTNKLNIAPFFVPSEILNLPKVFLDMQNDVTTKDVKLAITEGYQSIEHVKRYTALGFGTDQGKTSNVNGIAVAAKLLECEMEQVGTTTFRPAYTSVTFGALAGRHSCALFDPERTTPIHSSHLVAKAKFEQVGQWYRPWYFPKNNETMDQAVQREALAARTSLAIMDASTLGKIDIQGSDAREFLNRVYTNAWLKLPVGKCRYGIMCDEKGMIMDDGVTACIDENHFIMTTTTGGAAHVYSTLEMWLQTEWPELDVHLTSVTDHYSTIAVVGPNSRKLMGKICTDIDFDKESFKFMEWKVGTVAGVWARVMRISFSGELAYEINIQAHYANSLWQHIMQQGREWNITPYGTETLHVLRAEKGYIIVGQDTDGSVTPMDANMRWLLSSNKSFSYIGKRSFSTSALQANGRKQLVGLHTEDKEFVLPEGTHLINGKSNGQGQSIGHVTSSYYSPILQRSIALALIVNGLDRLGETITAHLVQPKYNDKKINCKIVNSVFYDPEGSKVDGND